MHPFFERLIPIAFATTTQAKPFQIKRKSPYLPELLMEPIVGFEPTAYRLQGDYSTIESYRRSWS